MLASPATTLAGLSKQFASQAKTFVREEVQLAKSELTENISALGGNAAMLGMGAFGALAGVIVLLVAFGMLVAFGFRQLQIDSSLAMAIGFGAIGLVAIIIGAIMVFMSVKAFSKQGVSPDRALAKLRQAPGVPASVKPKIVAVKETQETEAPKPRSLDLEKRVIATEDRLGRTFQELERRLTLGGARRRLLEEIQMHPYRAGLWALLAGFAASIYVGRKFRLG